jgi:cyclopropane fatty-acyl-phospholipid synthase-like methyltransferase
MNNNFEDLKKTWNDFGHIEPYWSVLTHEQFKLGNITEDSINEYFAIGEAHFQWFESILQSHQSTFKDKIVLDFGCGTGRILKPCAKVASKVYGVDISKPHLDKAKEYVPTAELYCVEDSEKLPTLPSKVDIIYSLMVFQHNRPPLMKKYIKVLLELLNTDGIAMFQIPYYIHEYHYNENEYQGRNEMEMHRLEKQEVMKLIQEANCQLLGEDETDHCGEGILNTTYIIKKL